MPLKKIIAPPYYKITKVAKFQATLTQAGLNYPVSAVINNEIGELSWTRVAPGVYDVTWADFMSTINTVFIQPSVGNSLIAANDVSNPGSIRIITVDGVTNTTSDDLLNGSYIEITAQTILS